MAFRLIRERREKRRVAKLDEIFQVLQYTIQIQIVFLVKFIFTDLPGIRIHNTNSFLIKFKFPKCSAVRKLRNNISNSGPG